MGTRGFSGGWIWSPFSQEEALARAEAVCAAALEGYEIVGRTIFAPLAPRLNTLATLPAEFVAYMEFRLDWPGPAFHWYLEPLEEGQPNKVTHTLRCSGPARSGITAGI